MKIEYVPKKFRQKSLDVINQANVIIKEYQDGNLKLTLRQLYYQFISRDLFPESWRDPQIETKNTAANYNKLGTLISAGRLAGLIDWESIEDRTRSLKYLSNYESPEELISLTEYYFRLDRWKNQEYRLEVWIEKDALTGVIENVCQKWHVPYFACKGYTSQSEMWSAAQRFQSNREEGKNTAIIHLGDHDPSGIDMTRDIDDRINAVFGTPVEIERIALNMNQVEEFDPPPNPAKITDSRAKEYIKRFGSESWELDALDPIMMQSLIEKKIKKYIDMFLWDEIESEEIEHIETIKWVSGNWSEILERKDDIVKLFLNKNDDPNWQIEDIGSWDD